jgi:hypothetical protein
MVRIGIFEASAVIAGGWRSQTVEVNMYDGSVIVIVIPVFPVIRRQVHVLVRRHQDRQPEGESQRKYDGTTHRDLIMLKWQR